MVWARDTIHQQVIHQLPQRRTNGKSLLGTLLAPLLPVFLSNNPLPNGFPWSNSNLNTNYYRDAPYTGVVRTYDFTISRGMIAPDGYQRETLLVNGAFPGPTIQANWGDMIQVTVHNNISQVEEGTSLHWHGFLQHGTPWEDGAPAITQCPIAPGKSYTYKFKASLYGTSWYHSHYSSQYAGGIVGPIVIYGPCQKQYDVDLGPIMLSDWYHRSYFDLVKETMKPGGLPFPSNNTLINGKNNFDCSTLPATDKTPCVSNAGISTFKFQRGKTHRLRLINTGAEALMRFSIDGHKMTVIANDFVPVEPYVTEVVTLGIGQRSDVIVKANGTLNAYWMRANVSVPCSISNQPNAVAAIYYDNTTETLAPQSTPWNVPDPGTCADDSLSLTRPIMKLPVPKPDLTYNLTITSGRNGSDILLWSMGGVGFRGDYNNPTLLLANKGNYSFHKDWSVRNTKNAKSVRVILNNHTPAPHPMHLHGFNMYILNEGVGDWDGRSIVHPENPQRRDVFQLRPNGHMVMQFDAADNPGVWPLHCHIVWHSGAGLFTQFLTAGDKLRRFRFPSSVADTCRDWNAWTHRNIPDQIDSGL